MEGSASLQKYRKVNSCYGFRMMEFADSEARTKSCTNLRRGTLQNLRAEWQLKKQSNFK